MLSPLHSSEKNMPVHFVPPGLLQFSTDRCQRRSPSATTVCAECCRTHSHRHSAMWTHHSGIAAAALVTCSAANPVQAGVSRLPCTVGLGAGLPCWRLSAGCWFWTEIPALCGATCLLCAMSEQHFRWPIIRCRRSACMEWAAVQSTWHWAIADYFQWTFEDLLILYRILRPLRICDIYDFI